MVLEEQTLAALPPVIAYARLLKESHDLIAQGKGDTEEAEALADRMDGPWYAMTPQEQERMRGLSVDFYALLEGQKRVDMSPEQVSQWQAAAREASAAFEAGNVDAMLTFLRQSVPSTLPAHVVPFLQAQCWDKLGDRETALVFMKEAEQSAASQAPSVPVMLQRLEQVEQMSASQHLLPLLLGNTL